MYYAGAEGALVCFDFTSMKSFENVLWWLKNLKENASESIKIVLIGTKWDLEDKTVTLHEARKFAYDLNMPFFHTSSKANLNIHESVKHLARLILAQQPPDHQPTMAVSLRTLTARKEKKKCC
jgi:Rab family protein